MLTVKLTQSWSIDPQDTALESVVNPPCWASKTVVSLNLTIPFRIDREPVGGLGAADTAVSASSD